MSLIDRRAFLQTAAALPFVPVFRHRRCILLLLQGGPSHVDTWDMKPAVRSPFRPIRTNVPGIEISEIFPRMARHAGKFTLVRSVYHDGPPDHETGLGLLNIGGPVVPPGSARQLVDSGEPLVTVKFPAGMWDCHGYGPFSTLTDYRHTAGPMFDSFYSDLLEGLHQRGLLATTLVVAIGEMGRTPRINPQGGRDHWTKCWTAVLAGGGIEGGQIYGSSDATGAEPRDNPVSLASIAALLEKHQTDGRAKLDVRA